MFEAWKVASGCAEALVTSPVEGSSVVDEGAGRTAKFNKDVGQIPAIKPDATYTDAVDPAPAAAVATAPAR